MKQPKDYAVDWQAQFEHERKMERRKRNRQCFMINGVLMLGTLAMLYWGF